ncbi:hypothetical protein Vretifemale_8456 [Volvox reticuliferus]|uniref:Zinc/iron permease n=1 Tax=Volvox reticuliferus TaxID=1737510 RepID=A0A8J4FJL8_9CHLO|nr:hypothetical protein Vretifemale_8456 [Volvox reticuliferus]
MLSAGLMLGSGLGVVVPEGFITFVEGAPGGTSGLPEWSAGAGLLAGFVGMLALQLWLQGDGQSHAPAAPAIPGATAASTAGGGSEGVAAVPGERKPKEGGGYGRSSAGGWRRRWDGGYSVLPSAAAVDVEMPTGRPPPGPSAAAAGAASSVAIAAGVTGGMELPRRHGGTPPAASAGGAAAPPAHASSSCASDAVAPLVPTSALSKLACAVSPPSSSHATSGVGGNAGDGSADIASSSSSVTIAPVVGGGGGGGGGGVSSAQLALGGLLIHSDGLAVGAASLGGGGGGGPSALSLSVAAAIMMHKLPVTLGLTTYLREAGWRRGAVLQALLSFSASAPLAALAAYYLLGMLLQGAAGDPSASGDGVSGQVVALAVLFSGGTFLAAATQHILPAAVTAAVTAGAGPDNDVRNVEGAVVAEKEARHVGGVDSVQGTSFPLMWLAVGALLPLLIAALLPEAG